MSTAARLLPLLLPALVLLAGVSVRAEAVKTKEELEAGAQSFVHIYDGDWKKRYPANFKTLAGEVAKVVECDEATARALAEGTKPIADKTVTHWATVYHEYYLSHYKLYSDPGFWDDYPEMLAGEGCARGIREQNEQWEALLKARLTPAQLARWQAEMQHRRELRASAGVEWLKRKLAEIERVETLKFAERVTALAHHSGMSDARANELTPAVKAAVAAELEIRRVAGEKTMREWDKDIRSYLEGSVQSLVKGNYNGYIAGIGAAGKAGTQVFDEAVQKLLTPAEKATKEKGVQSDAARIASAAKDMSGVVLQMAKARLLRQQQARIERLAAAAGLDEARRQAFKDRLEAAEKIITEQWTKDYIAGVIKRLEERRSSGDLESNLKQVEARRYRYSEPKADEAAAKAREAAWDQAVAAVLTPEEVARFMAAENSAGERRARVLAQVAISELDQRLLLTIEQRQSLEPMALRAALPLGRLPGEINKLWQGDLGGSLLLLHPMGVVRVEALLEGAQKRAFWILVERYKHQWEGVQTLLLKNNAP